ncbi:MAG: energy transducer TonB [Ferruginibacter sp.]
MMNLNKTLLAVYLLLPVMSFSQTAPDSAIGNWPRFTEVEVEATFPGGDAAWKTFLVKNLKAAVPADNSAPIGKYSIMVQFVVGKDGAVSNIKALTNFGYGMEDEVVRIIEKSGNWTPALQNGKAVNAYRKQPVTFVVEDNDFTVSSKIPYTLFAGIDNEITVNVKKVSPNNLNLMITRGNIITTLDGRFIARVTQPGRVTITVYNKKNDKELGVASFEVKKQSEMPAEMKQ